MLLLQSRCPNDGDNMALVPKASLLKQFAARNLLHVAHSWHGETACLGGA